MDFLDTQFAEAVVNWFLSSGVRVAAIIVVAWIVQAVLRGVVANAIRRVIKQGKGTKEAEEKRENTLIQVVNSALVVLIWVMVALMTLSELGVAIGPLLAAAGVAGVAIGFGGQYLIRDLITGMFILLENQYRAGDVICIGTTCGKVENVTLRMTTLRDLDGTVHHIPHGEITKVANLSKEFANVHLNIGIGYSSNLEHVIEVVNAVGSELAEDGEWKTKIRKAPQFLRVNEFADSAIIIKIMGETKPGEQWAVMGEFRKRLKIAFDKEKIEIPFPQMVVHQAK